MWWSGQGAGLEIRSICRRLMSRDERLLELFLGKAQLHSWTILVKSLLDCISPAEVRNFVMFSLIYSIYLVLFIYFILFCRYINP